MLRRRGVCDRLRPQAAPASSEPCSTCKQHKSASANQFCGARAASEQAWHPGRGGAAGGLFTIGIAGQDRPRRWRAHRHSQHTPRLPLFYQSKPPSCCAHSFSHPWLQPAELHQSLTIIGGNPTPGGRGLSTPVRAPCYYPRLPPAG